MKKDSYRISHQSTRITDRYRGIVYAQGSYDDIIWQEEKKVLDRELEGLNVERYLDFACGTGRIIAYLENRVKNSLGIDISKEMLEVAREQVNHSELLETDLTRSDVLVGKTFDLITAFRFFRNAEPELRNDALRVLNLKLTGDGVLIFNIHGNTWSYLLLMLVWYRLGGRNLNHMSYREVKQMLTSHGFYIVRMYGFGIVPKPLYQLLPVAFLLRIERAFLKIPFAKYISYNLIFVCKRA